MRTETINIYKFGELEEKAQTAALSEFRFINTSHDWWRPIYDDAKQIELEIEGFNLEHKNAIGGGFTGSAYESIKLILEHHGKDCDTYKIAESYKKRIDEMDESAEDYERTYEQTVQTFEFEIRNEYWRLLREEYIHLMSNESVKETIEANDYEFTADGRQWK